MKGDGQNRVKIEEIQKKNAATKDLLNEEQQSHKLATAENNSQ